MNCEVCGTELPAGAMFCGECGRAVTQRVAVAEVETAEESQPRPAPVRPPAPPVFGAGDTVAIDPVDLAALSSLGPLRADDNDGLLAEGGFLQLGSEDETPADEPDSDAQWQPPAEAAESEPEPEPEDAGEPEAPPTLVEPGSSSWSPEWQAALTAPVDIPSAADAEDFEQDLPPDLAQEESAADSVVDSSAWSASAAKVFTDAEDLEQTLIVPRREQGERFVLQFSTGESITVFGSGLLGRNPVPQPGEYYDQLVPISDPGKSVSKTHLEFGQDGGSFWVSDRFSGNGSIIREPESKPRRLTSGKRYRIVRGTRVDIAEQFFIVS